MDLLPEEQLQEIYGVSPEEWEALLADSMFMEMVRQASLEWSRPQAAEQRVRTKALLSIEISLPDWHRDMLDQTKPLKERLEVGKFIAKLGGFENKNVVGIQQLDAEGNPTDPAAIRAAEAYLDKLDTDQLKVMVGLYRKAGLTIPHTPEAEDSEPQYDGDE
jgi:hypothetical protein